MARTRRNLPGWYKEGEFLEGFKEDLQRGLVRMPKLLCSRGHSVVWNRKAKKFRKRVLSRMNRRQKDLD